MRRGPTGRGALWRNDNPRQYRPRMGNPNYRPRGYPPSLLDVQRFSVPPPGYRGPRPGNNHNNNNQKTFLNRTIQGHKPWNKHPKQGPRDFPTNPNFFDVTQMPHEQYSTNKFGDVDQRRPFMQQKSNQNNYPEHISPWAYDIDDNGPGRHDRHDRPDRPGRPKSRGPHRPYRYLDEPYQDQFSQRPPNADNMGHRPPASDYYDSVPGPAIDESNSFSRSVDDTVDIVRKKLMSRNDPQNHHNQSFNHNDILNAPTQSSEPNRNQQQNVQQHTPKKKKQKRSMEQNCETIKTKIVHQLFKMDKDKIHKLMDNPNSSTKFEYAINSLITESQNSLNRYMRSAAEKSLCGARPEVLQYNDNDTIYEDTFMKQMQCILGPQDTVFLEDIKPIVMAELNKVLQLDVNMEFPYEPPIGESNNLGVEDRNIYDSYHTNEYTKLEFSNEVSTRDSYPYKDYYSNEFDEVDNIQAANSGLEHNETMVFDNDSFKRRLSHVSNDSGESSFDVNKLSQDVDKPFNRKVRERCPTPVNFFDTNTEQVSEDEDPFAELDKQYHVAVGLNFIGSEDFQQQNLFDESQNALQEKAVIKVEPNCAILNEGSTSPDVNTAIKNLSSDINDKLNENLKESDKSKSHRKQRKVTVKKEPIETEKNKHNSNIKCESQMIVKSSTHYTTKKRSSDQKPLHRKEKRKKSESSLSETSNQILNKNIIINLNNDCKKSSEKCESKAKSVVNLFFSKSKNDKESTEKKDLKKNVDSNYSDKYVKRKESSRESTDNNVQSSVENRRSISTSSNHSMLSPTDNNTSTTPSKSDTHNKLKSIDIFTEQNNRKFNIHHAHRNTAVTNTSIKEEKLKTIPSKSISKQISRRHVATQTSLKENVKGTQTINKRLVNSVAQTDSMVQDKTKYQSNDPFERMKEIDLEIQVLVQEKFKLYNSLESKESSNSMQNLGMTVLNMVPDNAKDNDTNNISEDAIIDNFTNIPEDELEIIALETVSDESIMKNTKSPKKTYGKAKESKQAKSKRSNKLKEELKTPNISLLEQIITDDRPIEDIISLDDLEASPVKSCQKQKKEKSKKQCSKTLKKRKKNQKLPEFMHDIKECSVVLTRINMKNYEKLLKKMKVDFEIQQNESFPCNQNIIRHEDNLKSEIYVEESCIETSLSVEGTIIEGISFHDDMWDVSEDIVIGAEGEKKDMLISVPLTEEIVLDNSQSDEVVAVNEVDNQQATSECKVFDFSTDEGLKHETLTVTGNADAVLAIELIDNNFLAACLDGNVYYFSSEGQLLTTLRGSNLAVTCLTIVNEKFGTTVYTGSLDSRIRYYDLETGLEKGPECNVLSPIQTMDRAWDTVFVGTRTGFVLQFECKNNMLIPVSTVKFSDQAILALRALKEGPRKVLLVASRSESVTIKDAQTGLLLRTLDAPKMTVYSLLFEDGKVYCGTSSNQIQVFDYSSGSHIGEHEGGKGAVCLRAAGGLLFAGCYDGCVYAFKAGEPRPFAQFRGPSVMLLSLAVQGTKIIAGYKDRSLFVWKMPVQIIKEMIL